MEQPFNAFLSGFSAAVGQFVLTASLRMQTVEQSSSSQQGSGGKSAGKGKAGAKGDGGEGSEGGRVSSERYVFPYCWAVWF